MNISIKICCVLLILFPFAVTADTSTADHSQFEQLKRPFEKAPEVTKACLECHTEASKQIHKTKHWNWSFANPATGEQTGKVKLINNYCMALESNYPRCTSCHIGYGWKDKNFDFTSEINVDCLVCHDTTGTYKKFPAGAGHPPYKDMMFPPKNKLFKKVDLNLVAQNVGKPSRASCGSCHFFGGDGDGVKHGDMDSSLTNPKREVDVHMAKEGADFICSDCHTTDGHDIKGSRVSMTAKDTHGIDIPGDDDMSRASCESCHGLEPHQAKGEDSRLDDHSKKVACVTCHIPKYARGGKPTMLWWDWSTAGKKNADGKLLKIKNEIGEITYHTLKGNFKWGRDLVPDYAWFSGDFRFINLEDKIDPTQVVNLNPTIGSADDGKSRIWPFKIMRGKQPYDKVNNTLAIVHLFGKDTNALWKSFSWKNAIGAAMQSYGAEFSGEYDFVETEMYWPLTHMVAPKEQALDCVECHSENGRLSKVPGIYMPAIETSSWVDKFGWLLVLATLIGVLLHGLARIIASRKGGRQS